MLGSYQCGYMLDRSNHALAYADDISDNVVEGTGSIIYGSIELTKAPSIKPFIKEYKNKIGPLAYPTVPVI